MTPESHCPYPPAIRGKVDRNRRGFNLIEAAIVLGVIGLIIGGIWIAAAAVSKEHKANQAVAGYLSYVTQVRERFPVTIWGTLGGEFPLSTPDAVNLSLPDGFRIYGTWQIRDPFDNPVGFYVNTGLWGSDSQPAISIQIHNLPNAAGTASTDPSNCLKFIPKLTAQMGTSGPLRQVVFCDLPGCSIRTHVFKSSFPISPSTSNCQSAQIVLAFDP